MKPCCPDGRRPGSGWRTAATVIAALFAAFYLVQAGPSVPPEERVAFTHLR